MRKNRDSVIENINIDTRGNRGMKLFKSLLTWIGFVCLCMFIYLWVLDYSDEMDVIFSTLFKAFVQDSCEALLL